MNNDQPIKKLLNVVLREAQKRGAEELVIDPPMGKETPVRLKIRDLLQNCDPFPAVLRPAVVGELARLANLAGGKFPKDGILDCVTSGASSK